MDEEEMMEEEAKARAKAELDRKKPKEKRSPLRMAAELTPMTRTGAGLGEAALSLGTGAVATPLGGYAGLAGTAVGALIGDDQTCLLYTSPSPRDA